MTEPRTACPACASPDTESLMTIPAMPVHVGVLWNTRESAVGCDQAEMALTLCSHFGRARGTRLPTMWPPFCIFTERERLPDA